MIEQFRVISLSHKTAPVEVREVFSLTSKEAGGFVSQLNDLFGIREAMIVSTCNRTEIYYTSYDNHNQEIISLLNTIKDSTKKLEEYCKQYNGREAVNHLFRVSLGLESGVLGDLQITSQVKNAYQVTCNLNLATHFLHRLMHAIFYANKRLVSETSFRDGAASVPYAATDLIRSLVSDQKDVPVLIVGLGKIGENVARNLYSQGYTNVTITNRTYEKAAAIEEELGYQAIDFTSYKRHLQESTIIVTAFHTEEPQVGIDDFSKDIHDHKYIIDLSLPRVVSTTVEKNPAILLHNIDEIEAVTEQALAKRKHAIKDVENIIRQSIDDFEEWSKDMKVSPTIHKIKESLETIRKDEMERYLRQLQLTDKEAEAVEVITKSMMQKIIKLPVLQLKAACRRGDGEMLADVLNDLFDLEKNTKKA